MTVTASASPSLALIKYWGKMPEGTNLPATPSLAITLHELRTTTTVGPSARAQTDEVVLEGTAQPNEAYEALFTHFRERAGLATPSVEDGPLRVESANNFPTAAGLASSSSGFAALALALDAWFDTRLSPRELSAAARMGSGSASRAVWGGYTVWPAGSEHAEPLLPPDHWPELRVIVTVLHSGSKPISSRAGMIRTATTSPIYARWCEASPELFDRGVDAVRRRDLSALGAAMRESYLFMFSTMFTARPPVVYWLPQSLSIIHAAEDLRSAGVPVWETMDAGPQVKLVTSEEHVARVSRTILERVPDARLIVASVGGAPEVRRGE